MRFKPTTQHVSVADFTARNTFWPVMEGRRVTGESNRLQVTLGAGARGRARANIRTQTGQLVPTRFIKKKKKKLCTATAQHNDRGECKRDTRRDA